MRSSAFHLLAASYRSRELLRKRGALGAEAGGAGEGLGMSLELREGASEQLRAQERGGGSREARWGSCVLGRGAGLG